eukprot:2450856-Amphidinium_carterae.1
MAAAEDVTWPSLKSEVSAIVASSALGKHVFSFVMRGISEALVDDIMKKHIDALKSQSALTEDNIVTCRNTMKTELATVPGLSDLHDRREITLEYRGWKVKAWTKSVEEQVAMRLNTAVRGWLAQLELIPMLPGESVLCATDAALSIARVDGILFRDAKVAREHLLMVLRASSVKDGALVKA